MSVGAGGGAAHSSIILSSSAAASSSDDMRSDLSAVPQLAGRECLGVFSEKRPIPEGTATGAGRGPLGVFSEKCFVPEGTASGAGARGACNAGAYPAALAPTPPSVRSLSSVSASEIRFLRYFLWRR